MLGALQEYLWRQRDALLANPDAQDWSVNLPIVRSIANNRARDLFSLCTGFIHTQIVTACVELDVLEALASGPISAEDVAAKINLEAASAERLLDAAVALRLVRRSRSGHYRLDELGAALRGAPGVMEMIRHNQTFYRDARDPVAILKRAQRTTELAEYWPYAEGDEKVKALQDSDTNRYSKLMAATQPQISSDVIAAYSFRKHSSLLDIGGGNGAFVTAVATSAPKLRVSVLDLPPVAEQARLHFKQMGLENRASAIGGDFHRDPLPNSADIISLVRILLDHDDDKVRHLLAAVHKALPPGGRILIAEPMSRAPGAELLSDAYFGLYLMAMGRGRTRTADHIRELLGNSGFTNQKLLRTRRPLMTQVIIANKD
ncbi:MAG: methyltransferase [Pseudomonadota bacterium]